MNAHQLLLRQQERDAITAAQAMYPMNRYLNCAPEFWEIYRSRTTGSVRRRALVALFSKYPTAKLPVNNRYQANTVDPDLSLLLKRGILVQVRDRGRMQHRMNKSSSKRQTYLMLAANKGAF